MDFPEACRVLFTLPRFDLQGAVAIKPGLQNMRALLGDLGNPHERYPTIHVAGTNGKGSVCSMLAAILTVSGKRVGLHTSPHLISLTERLRVDGRQAEEDWVADAVERMLPAVRRVKPSFFEASTALAFLYFAERTVDVAVIEVGLGGRLDATNIIRPHLSVITNIGRDHVAQLGDTLPMIAREKAGIIKPGVPVVTAACQPEVRSVIKEAAEATRAPLVDVCRPPWGVEWDGSMVSLRSPDGGKYRPFKLDLPGRHQHSNALAALAGAWTLLPHGDLEQVVVEGLSNVRSLTGLRGRCEVVRREPLVMVDVSHNEDGIRAALECLDLESKGGRPAHVLMGLASDKDVPAILAVLAKQSCILMPASIPGERGLPPAEMAGMAVRAGLRIVEIGSADAGWRYFVEHAEPRDRLLVVGSHYLLGTLPEDLFPRRAASPA
ncbi:MAG TPA: folylpolyglutamate synthase/dihydrofolate synthase family protein [Rhodothermia bacterium]